MKYPNGKIINHPYFLQYVEAKSGQTLEIHNPTDGSLVASNIHVAGEADVDDAVAAATKAFKEGPWSQMNGAKRAGLLNKFADLFEKNVDEIINLESYAMGIPVGGAKMFAYAIPAYFRCMSLLNLAWGRVNSLTWVQIMQDTQTK